MTLKGDRDLFHAVESLERTVTFSFFDQNTKAR